jgi:nitrogen regulatory protein PII
MLQIVVSDDLADEVVEIIAKSARTEKIGDGKIWTTAVENAVRIRTGETGVDAL